MQLLIVNIILALNLTYFVGVSAPWDLNKPLVFIIVFAISFIVVYLPSYFYSPRYFRKIPILMRFCWFIFKELVESNIRVARDVITPKPLMHPAIIRLPLELEKDRDVVTLGLLITFTPGTLCMFVDKREIEEQSDNNIEEKDKKYAYTMYIHEMYIPKPKGNQPLDFHVEKEKEQLKAGFESKIKILSS